MVSEQQKYREECGLAGLHGDYGDGKNGRLELACATKARLGCGTATTSKGILHGGICRSTSDRCGDVAGTASSTSSAEVGDGGKAADEADVEEDGDVGEESDAGETEGEEDGEGGVDDGGAGHTGHGSDIGSDGDVVVSEHGEVVGEDAAGDDGAA